MSATTGPQLWERFDGTSVEVNRDVMNSGSSRAVMAEEHAEIHMGNSYTGGMINTGLGTGLSLLMAANNANSDKEIHIVAAIATSGDVIVRTWGGITGCIGGSAALSYNRLTGLTDSGVAGSFGCTSLTGGLAIKEAFIPGGSGPLALGGQSGFRAERIVKVNSWLGLEVENVSGGSLAHVSIEWDFYLADPLNV